MSSEENKFDYFFKVTLIGDTNVGKTNLLSRFTKNEFDFHSDITVGVAIDLKIVQVDEKHVKVQFWDANTSEAFFTLLNSHCKGAVGVMLTYDISKYYTYNHAKRCLKELRDHSDQDIVIMLVGNKSDKRHLREVPTDEARDFADLNNLSFIETSALDSTNVEAAFQQFLKDCLHKVTEGSNRKNLFKETYECEVFTWKIPNVSSLEISDEDTALHSPKFVHKNASWILKMYPHGRKKFGSGNIDMILKRLHDFAYRRAKHDFIYNIFFKSQENKQMKYSHVVFDSDNEEEDICFDSWNWRHMFYQHNKCRQYDTITLVLEIYVKKNVVNGLELEEKSAESSLDWERTTSESALESVGEIFSVSFEVEAVLWKIPDVNSIPKERDTKVHSPSFFAADATWIMKMFMYGQKKYGSEDTVHVEIERLHSQIPKHFVSCNIFFADSDSAKKIFDNDDRQGKFWDCNGRYSNFLNFDSNHKQAVITNVYDTKNFFELAFNNSEPGTVCLFCVFRTKKNLTIELDQELVSPEDYAYKITDNSEVPEIGVILQAPHVCGVLTWKIPNVSSLEIANDDTCLKSQQFFYNGASWILKMYPYGFTNFPDKGYIHVALERLSSQVPLHELSFYVFLENYNGERSVERTALVFDSTHVEGCTRISSPLWHDIFSNKGTFRRYNTITFICELYAKKQALETVTPEALGCRNSMIEGQIKSTGDLSYESFELKAFVWKIPDVNSILVERGGKAQSPPFSFANASWILKLFLLGQKKYKSEGHVDVEIERLYSEISEHLIYCEVFPTFSADMEKTFDGYMHDRFERQSFNFDSNHKQAIVTNVCSTKEFFDLSLNNYLQGSVFIVCVFRINKNYATDIKSSELASDASVPAECFYCKAILEAINLSSLEDIDKAKPIKCTTCDKILTENYFNHDCMINRIKAQEKLLHDLKRIMLCGDHSDTTIRVKEENFRLHKSVLGARNPFFDSMFKNDVQEAKSDIITIDNCEPDQFRSLIYYIYNGAADKLSPETVCDIYEVAVMYQEERLKAECLQFMLNTISVDSFCDYIELAVRHEENSLLQIASDFFTFKPKEIPRSAKWKAFVKKHPDQVNELYLKALNTDQNKRCLTNDV